MWILSIISKVSLRWESPRANFYEAIECNQYSAMLIQGIIWSIKQIQGNCYYATFFYFVESNPLIFVDSPFLIKKSFFTPLDCMTGQNRHKRASDHA